MATSLAREAAQQLASRAYMNESSVQGCGKKVESGAEPKHRWVVLQLEMTLMRDGFLQELEHEFGHSFRCDIEQVIDIWRLEQMYRWGRGMDDASAEPEVSVPNG